MIIAVTLLIAALGAVLIALLLDWLRVLEGAMKLKAHRSQIAGLADLLNYAAVVDDGVIVCKNGSFMAAWTYSGADDASSTHEQRNAVSARINQAIKDLGNGWMLHIDCVRHPAPNYSPRADSAFPDPICAAIDEERRHLFENMGALFEGRFILTATWYPPMLAQAKFTELMFDDDTPVQDRTARTQGLIAHFQREIGSLESRLSSAVKLTRLGGKTVTMEDGSTVTHDDLLAWLQFCITGERHPVQLPSNPMYLDSILGGQELYTGVIPKIGRKLIQVVAIDGFPMESHPGILASLAELPCEYRWSSRFIFLDQHEAIAQLDKYRKKWRQKIRGFFDQVFNTASGAINQDAALMTRDAEDAIAEVSSGMVACGYYTSVVILMDEDRERLQAASRQVEKAIQKRGFGARVETINTLDAYLGSLPGHGTENVRRPLLNTMNLSDLLPTSSIWTGRMNTPCPFYPPHSPALMHCVTVGSTPFRLNLHVRDLGHTFMFGPTGAGKSTHLAILAAQFRRYRGMSVFAFDKGGSMYPLAAAIRASTHGRSGRHFTPGGDGDSLAFCPLQFLDTQGDRAWAMEWIDTVLRLNGVETTPTQRNEIGNAIVSMNDSGARTLSEFSLTVQDQMMREALKQYTIDGMMGHLLDAEEDGLALSDFTVFEIEDLMNLGEKYALPVLLYLFRRIERALTGQPAVIILDEAWLMLGHDAFREKIREWFKVLRKANCLVLLATQSLSDAANSGILDVIVESTATKIFLPNIYARDEDTAALYRRMGLNSRQIEILASAEPKRHYYYLSEEGRRLYDLALGPLAMAFVGASDKDSLNEIRALERQFGNDWVREWLASRDLVLEHYIPSEPYREAA